MRRAAVVALACAMLIAGCAVPRWVPFLGTTPRPEPATPVAAKPPAPPLAEPAPGAKSMLVTEEGIADRVVAVVNNDAITLAEIQESIIAARQEGQASSASDDELASRFLNRLIDTRLQLQEADREKIVVDDAEVTEQLAERVKRFGSKTLEEFEAMLRANGITLDVIRKRLRDNLRVAKIVRRKVALRVSVTEAEVDRYVEENRAKLETGLAYHARHILVVPDGTSEAAWAAARARAERLRTEVLGGADFGELARRHSGDEATAKDGGDLGLLKRGELDQEIERKIVSLAPGEVSQPHRSELGYHVFLLEAKATLEGEALARARQQIKDILFREKYEARLEAWLKEIRQRAIIEVRL